MPVFIIKIPYHFVAQIAEKRVSGISIKQRKTSCYLFLIFLGELHNLFEEERMDRGVIMVSEVLRLLQAHREATESSQTSCHSIQDTQRKPKKKEQVTSQAIKLVRRDRDLFGRALRLHPQLSSPHIYKLFGFVGINERALQDPDYEESFFKTHLHGRIVERVQIYDNAVVVEMVAPQPNPDQLAVAQIIEAYKRRGCMKFYELAKQIQQIMELFGGMENTPTPPEKPESLKKCLDSLGDSMFVCTSGIRKFAISKSLLSYLEYDIEEFCIQAVKFRGIFIELFSAGSYFTGLTHIISLLKYTVQLANDQISLSQFREFTTFRFTDFIYSKNQVKSYCDMSFSLLNPSILCHKVNYIYYREKEPWRTGLPPAIQDEKERMRQREYQVIRKVKNIPNSLLTENQQLIAGYKVVREESETDSINESQPSIRETWGKHQEWSLMGMVQGNAYFGVFLGQQFLMGIWMVLLFCSQTG